MVVDMYDIVGVVPNAEVPPNLWILGYNKGCVESYIAASWPIIISTVWYIHPADNTRFFP